MEQNMKGNGTPSRMSEKEGASKFGPMVLDMMATGLTTWPMDMDG